MGTKLDKRNKKGLLSEVGCECKQNGATRRQMPEKMVNVLDLPNEVLDRVIHFLSSFDLEP